MYYSPQTPVEIYKTLTLAVSPGDTIIATMEYTAGNAAWILKMTNQTQGGRFAQASFGYSLSGSNAGFYVGTISIYHQAGSTQYPLPNFGSVTFQNVELRFSAGWVGLNTQQYQPVDLVQNTSTLLQASPLNGESFTVTRLNP